MRPGRTRSATPIFPRILAEAGFADISIVPREFHVRGEFGGRHGGARDAMGPSGRLLDEKRRMRRREPRPRPKSRRGLCRLRRFYRRGPPARHLLARRRIKEKLNFAPAAALERQHDLSRKIKRQESPPPPAETRHRRTIMGQALSFERSNRLDAGRTRLCPSSPADTRRRHRRRRLPAAVAATSQADVKLIHEAATGDMAEVEIAACARRQNPRSNSSARAW